MGESRHRRMIELLLFDPFGMIGLFFLMLGMAGTFIYGVLLAYEHISIYNWKAWLYPLLFICVSFLFLWFSFYNMRRSGQRFIQEIKREEKALEKCIKYLEQGKCLPNTIDTSEFGINNLDIEVEQMVKESGGFVPVLSEELKESPFSHEQAIKSLAKLSFLRYIRIPEAMTGLKITITSKGLDTLELPKITFTTKMPEDIALMLGYAHALYRNHEFETAIGKCYNLLERALKVHLIPSIDDCQKKWDEYQNRLKNQKEGYKPIKWKGSKTKVGLDALITFYKENTKMDKESYKFMVESVKYISEMKNPTAASCGVSSLEGRQLQLS